MLTLTRLARRNPSFAVVLAVVATAVFLFLVGRSPSLPCPRVPLKRPKATSCSPEGAVYLRASWLRVLRQ